MSFESAGGAGPRNIAAVRLKAERVKTLRGPGEPARDVPDGLVHRLDNADEPLCGAAVTPLYLVEWEWDQLNDLMQCPVCATLVQSSLVTPSRDSEHIQLIPLREEYRIGAVWSAGAS